MVIKSYSFLCEAVWDLSLSGESNYKMSVTGGIACHTTVSPKFRVKPSFHGTAAEALLKLSKWLETQITTCSLLRLGYIRCFRDPVIKRVWNKIKIGQFSAQSKSVYQSVCGICRVFGLFRMPWKQSEGLFGLHYDCVGQLDGQFCVQSFSDRSGADSPTPHGCKAWLAGVRNPNQEPGLWCFAYVLGWGRFVAQLEEVPAVFPTYSRFLLQISRSDHSGLLLLWHRWIGTRLVLEEWNAELSINWPPQSWYRPNTRSNFFQYTHEGRRRGSSHKGIDWRLYFGLNTARFKNSSDIPILKYDVTVYFLFRLKCLLRIK